MQKLLKLLKFSYSSQLLKVPHLYHRNRSLHMQLCSQLTGLHTDIHDFGLRLQTLSQPAMLQQLAYALQHVVLRHSPNS